MLRLFLVLAFSMLALTLPAHADFQELFPDNNVSGRKILLLEARKGLIEGGTSGPVGHAFVKLATELDNGLIQVHSTFGYYPKGGKLYEIKLIAGTAGDVKFELPADLQTDISQKYYISDSIYNALKETQNSYLSANPTYSLLGANNCVKFVAEMAKVSGLGVPDVSTFTTPGAFIEAIQSKNGVDPNTIEQKEPIQEAAPAKKSNSPIGNAEGETRQENYTRNEGTSGREILQGAIDSGIPITQGGLTPSDGGNGNITFGWPTIKIYGGGGGGGGPRCPGGCIQR